MIQNVVSTTETPFISCHNESNTSWSEMIWQTIFSWVFCENTSLYRPSAAEENNKNKMPNVDWNSVQIWTKSWNCTEIASDWRIAQCMKYWMHTVLGYHFLLYSITLFKILKQMNNSQRRNSVFCFSWKVVKMQIRHFVLLPTLCYIGCHVNIFFALSD